MTISLTTSPCDRFEIAVRSLCPIIKGQVNQYFQMPETEHKLRRELVACILGSQVRYEMATTALERMEYAGLLDDSWWNNENDGFESEIQCVLSGKISKFCDGWRYRFPNIRAFQLAQTRCVLHKRSLSKRFSDIQDPKQLRQDLVTDIPGIGPKQASMFLRNVGKSYNLAILDTHMLRFMSILNLLSTKKVSIGILRNYEQIENIAVEYARNLGYAVGILDLAIWVTMRAARELEI